MTSCKNLALLTLIVASCLAGTACNQKGKGEPQKSGGDPMATEGRKTDDKDGWLFHEKDDKFHIRLKVDSAKKEATARILDDKIKEEVPITADALTLSIVNGKPPKQIELKAQRKGKGSTPLFVGTGDALGGKLDPAKIQIQAKIDGTPYVFELDTEHDPKKK